MTRLLAALLFVTLAPSARADTPGSQAEAEVLSDLRARLDAAGRNDTEAWARFVADDCIGPMGGAAPMKQAWIQEHKAWPPGVKYYYGPLEDVRVRVHGETAIVTFRSKQFNEYGGQTTYQNRWQIETWMRREGRWQLVAIADGVIPLEPTAATIDPAVYDAYVGRYEWGPGMVSTVTRQGNALFETFMDEKPGELLPENATTFFLKGQAASGDSSRYIFVKGAAGWVTHFIHRDYGGTDRVVKRMAAPQDSPR
jgi:ketosteroid isomerase-like protein